MATINPYLNFNGNTEEAFNFYKSVFGGEFEMVLRFKDMEVPGQSMGDPNLIMHIALPISKETVLMGSDVPSEFPQAVTGSNVSLSYNPDSKEAADKVYNALSAGGTVTMPMDNAPWGAYFGMCNDKYGIQWMINFNTQG